MNKTNNKNALVIASRLPYLLELADEEGYTKRELRDARENNVEELIKSQYGNIYRIFRDNFSYYKGNRSSVLELLAEFDNVSGELTKFTGWLEAVSEDGDDEESKSSEYASLTLNPVRTQGGLIYHLKGTLEWNSVSGEHKNNTIPLSIVPVYGIPSGRIIELKPAKIGDSWIFDNAKIEYRSFDLRVGG